MVTSLTLRRFLTRLALLRTRFSTSVMLALPWRPRLANATSLSSSTQQYYPTELGKAEASANGFYVLD